MYKDIFVADIVRLYSRFLSKITTNIVELQIKIIDSDLCRYFHIDSYRQRLLCTYKGPGTEWLDPSNVDQESLKNGAYHQIAKDVNKIHKAKPFEVLLIKGTRYEGSEKVIVHRSPPIKKSKKTRVLLKIDERG